MPKLVLLNGPPGIGKSTLAQRYVDDHPLALNLDIDVVRRMLGRWLDAPGESGLAARAMAIEMARVRLAAGHDVVVPQLVARAPFLEQLEQLARDTGATFHEIVLMADRAEALARFRHRSAAPRTVIDVDARMLAERAESPERLYDRLAGLLATRSRAIVVDVTDGAIDAAYQAVLRGMAAGDAHAGRPDACG